MTWDGWHYLKPIWSIKHWCRNGRWSNKYFVNSCISTERQFLSDFVAGAESTAGGRLARWLSPAPRVEPSRCELRPPAQPARPATRLSLPVLLRDQYGDPVASPALRVEVRRLISENWFQGCSTSLKCHHIESKQTHAVIRNLIGGPLLVDRT